MKENKNNEQEEQPVENIPEAIHPPGETAIPEIEAVAPEQPQIPDLNPDITDMEVHHHTHPAHGKKTWKEYFWEFLMLFLAVFCGFLAEYQLEHVIEHNREKQFINSMITDLQDDIHYINYSIKIETEREKNLDTLIDLLNNPALAKQQGDQLYYTARMGPRYEPFSNNSRTFDQLRYSGGFRLIRNAEASDKIMGYYNQFTLIHLMEDNYNHEFDNYKRVAAGIFDPGILRRQEGTDGEIVRSNDNPVLQTYDGKLLKELGFHTLQMNGSRRSKLSLLEKLKKTADELIILLKNNYHL